ncbi:MAG: efflux RND transporter permease subunit [Ruminococcaceae bacterium]|nr:efflux RND transporter permease subunit [Oscillospiraceae bacterium]
MLAKFSVKKPFTVLVAVILVIVLGVVAFTHMTPDLFPNIELPYAIVVTTYPGASPEEVEEGVTKPMEQSMSTLNGIKTVGSTSSENASVVTLEFESGTDMNYALVNIREKIDAISGTFDDMVGTPFILQINPDILPAVSAAVIYEGKSNVEVSEFVENTLKTKLEGIEGVAAVNLSGIVYETINVELDDEKIAEQNERISDAIREEFRKTRGSVYYGINQANDAMNSLDGARNQLSAAQTTLANQIESTRIQLTNSKQQLETLKANGATIKSLAYIYSARSQYAAINPTATAAEVDAHLRATDTVYVTAVNSMPTTPEVALAAMGLSADALPALAQQVDTADASISAIDDALSKLNIQSSVMAAELSGKVVDVAVGKATLSGTVSQLQSALTQIKSSEEAALESADLTGMLTLQNISAILTAQNFSMPAGYINEGGTRYMVSVGNEIADVDELRDIVLVDLGIEGVEPVRLSDVADVFVSDNSGDVYARIGDNDGVLVSFTKQSGYATAEVAANINEEFSALSEKYDGLSFTNLMDQGEYIHLVVNSVLENLLLGAGLAIIILWLFLRDIRPTFITACSIPISLTFAIVLMYFSGVTLNIISLAGLAVGVGMLVDNSIVVIENIYRLRNMGLSPSKAAISGAAQVTSAIVSSTLTTVCVFFPIVFVEGITRQLFTDMALTIAYALLASLVVALTLVPAMARGVLKKEVKQKENKSYNKLLSFYEKFITKALNHKVIVMSAVVVLLVGSLLLSLMRGFKFMPEMGSNQLMISLSLPEDNTVADTAKTVDALAAKISEVEGVETVGSMLSAGLTSVIGLGESQDDPSSVTMYVIIGDEFGVSNEKVTKEVDAMLEASGLDASSSSTMQMMSFTSAIGGSGVTVNVYGDDLDELRDTARMIESELSKVEGIAETSDGIGETTPELRITVDKDKAMAKGLTVAQVYMEISTALTSNATSTTLEYSGESRDIVVATDETSSLDRKTITDYVFTVTGMDGKKEEVKLSDIATITDEETMNSISRSAQRRYATVTGTLAKGYNISLVSAEAEKAVQALTLPDGITVEFSGENETIMSSLGDLLIMLLLGVLIVYLIMVAQFQSLLSPLIVMFTIPLAFTGGLIALLITGYEISVVAMIGFIMLVGIIVNNGIVLIDYVNRLRTEGKPLREAIVEAGITRLRPVLMTALTTVLGLLPLALGIGLGADMMQPVAIVCIGGRVYATVMTLFVIPGMSEALMKKDLVVLTDEELEVSNL